MIITKKFMPRRTFLRGMMGATMSLPLLEAMVPAATPLARTAANPVRRLGFVFMPMGCDLTRWTPPGKNLDQLSPILTSLAPVRENVTIISNLELANAYPGTHATSNAAFLSAAKAKLTESSDYYLGTTADQIAAQQIGQETQLPSLELAMDLLQTVGQCDNGYACVYQNNLSWSSPTTPLPAEAHPRIVFESLFGEGGSVADRRAALHRRASLLDSFTQDLARLKRELGPGDRARVSQYLDTVREVERRIQKSETDAANSPLPDLDRPVGVPAAYADHARLMFDLQLLALQGDFTRVITFQLARETSNRTYPEIGVSDPHHPLSHHGNDPEKIAKMAKINQFHVSLFAEFVAKLKATKEGNGTLLDHSLYLYGSGMGNPNVHDHKNLPIIVAGGAAGGMKGGRHIAFDKPTPLANLHLTLLDKVGVRIDSFADSKGKVDELFEPPFDLMHRVGLQLLSLLGLAILVAVSAQAANLKSPLADAAEKSEPETIRSLLKQHTDVNAAQADGMTALHWAAHLDDLETAKLLVKGGADVKTTNYFGVTPLSLACENGDTDLLELLLAAGADPNTTLRGGETALMTAARTGKTGPVKTLLAHGAKVDAKERRGQTALMWAAAEGHTEVVEVLIKAGADFRTPLAESGFTPLFFAVRDGRTDVVKALLKAGVDVNETMQPRKSSGKGPKKGMSSLVLAVENGHFDLAVALLEAGADPNDQRSGFTALHTLTWVRKPNRGDGDDGDPAPIGSGKSTSLQFAKKLVEHRANVNARLETGSSGKSILTRKGATPFLLAAVTADTAYLRLLIELGADPSIPNAENATPLMAAAGLGCQAPTEEAGTEPEVLEAVEFILAHAADINAVDDNGETAMHGAAYKNLPKVVQLLADKGAKIEIWNRKNKWGWTPLSIAEGYRVGNFKPSFETIDAIHHVMLAAGITPVANITPASPESRLVYP